MNMYESRINAAVGSIRIVLNDTLAEIDDVTRFILGGKDEVLDRYQPIFSPDHIPLITEEEFKSFLNYKNNRHWGGLQRVVITAILTVTYPESYGALNNATEADMRILNICPKFDLLKSKTK